MDLRRIFDVSTAVGASAARPYFGNRHRPRTRVPSSAIELYEFEACPYCRLVREAASCLSLDVNVYPCPKGGERFRPKVKAEGGRDMFPYLIDQNTGVRMYESADIARYLFEQYGDGRVPWYIQRRGFAVGTSMMASAFRARRGLRAVPSRRPERTLELYAYEGSPYCRIVREALCELELAYVLHNVPRQSPGRPAFQLRSSKMQVPFLVDDNTGARLFESAEIVAYLYEVYAIDPR